MTGEEKITVGLLILAIIAQIAGFGLNVTYLAGAGKFPTLPTGLSMLIYGGFVYPFVLILIVYALMKGKQSVKKNELLIFITLLGAGVAMAVGAGLANIGQYGINFVPEFNFIYNPFERKQVLDPSATLNNAISGNALGSILGATACLTSVVLLVYSKL